jgi:hypothetical protein
LNWSAENTTLEQYSSCSQQEREKLKAITCDRCGIQFEVSDDAYTQRLTRGVTNPDWCSDCRGYNPSTGCRGWSGDVDDNFMPLKNGKPYLPGLRTCGRVDCVVKAHIVGQIPDRLPVDVRGCCVEGCERPHNARGKCMMHYRQDHRTGFLQRRDAAISEALQFFTDTPTKNYCAVPLCGQKFHAKGLCFQHYRAAVSAIERVA